jgi:hypothetical protein
MKAYLPRNKSSNGTCWNSRNFRIISRCLFGGIFILRWIHSTWFFYICIVLYCKDNLWLACENVIGTDHNPLSRPIYLPLLLYIWIYTDLGDTFSHPCLGFFFNCTGQTSL